MTARTLPVRRRLLAIVLVLALGLVLDLAWGPGGCDPKHAAVHTP